MSDRRDRTIPELLAEHGPATGPDLAELLDAHPLTVERRCTDLQRAGRVRQDTGGRYTLWERGHRDTAVRSD